MRNNMFNLSRITAIFIAAYLITACSKPPVSVPADEPVVSGSTVRFSAKSLTVQHLITAPVVSAQEGKLSLPARIVWDEDHTSRITSPVAGRLSQIVVETGASVSVNQPLAYLNSPELGSAQAESVRAQAELAQAERSLARTKELVTINGVAGKDLEQAQLDLARARIESDRTALRLKSLGAESSVDQRYTLRSSIAGVVVERNANPGMEWRPDQPGAPLFVVSDPTYLWCWIDAPEHVLGLLHSGMKVTLHASAWPDEIFNAQIDHIEDALDPTSRTMKVRAKLRNPERHLKGEMYVTAELTSKAHGVLDIPVKAVFLSKEKQHVFVKTAEGEYTSKTIVPVASNEQWTSIEQGLSKGDEVVVDGGLYLQKLLDENSQSDTSVASSAVPTDKPPVK